MVKVPEPELWTPEETAEFLLNNSWSEESYRQNLADVIATGVDPLALNPAHLDRAAAWARAELYSDLPQVKGDVHYSRSGGEIVEEQPEYEIYTPERIAEFHLNNALDEEGYRWAVGEILAMGLDPRALNPAHLFHEEPWQNVELYLDASSLQRTS